MRYIYLIVFTLASINVYSTEADCSAYESNNYAELRNIEVFTGRSVGIAGSKPDHIKAYDCILKSPNASEIFESLLNGSFSAGQLYGLLGLSEVNPPLFESLKHLYEFDTSEVRTRFGCIGGTESISEIVKHFVYLKSSGVDESEPNNKPNIDTIDLP